MKVPALPPLDQIVGRAPAARPWLDVDATLARAERNLDTVQTRELWKYTPLRGYLDVLAEAPATDQADFGNAEQPGLRVAALADASDADAAWVRELVAGEPEAARHPLTDLALLKAGGGWLVDVSDAIEQPLEIRYPVAGGIVPVFVRLATNASLTLIEQVEQQGFLAQATLIQLGRGARLAHHRLAATPAVPHHAHHRVHVADDAEYLLRQACTGGDRRRSEVHVMLAGPGARADLAGAYLVEHGQHLDQQLLIEHRAAQTTSRQKFHGIGAGKGRSVLNGRIHIHRHAPGSDAVLNNRNLALHPEAEMNTKPELEIYTDDVRCAHGATVGQLSDEALFYLLSRGFPEADARRLLAHAFLRECLDGPLAEAAAQRLLGALR